MSFKIKGGTAELVEGASGEAERRAAAAAAPPLPSTAFDACCGLSSGFANASASGAFSPEGGRARNGRRTRTPLRTMTSGGGAPTGEGRRRTRTRVAEPGAAAFFCSGDKGEAEADEEARSGLDIMSTPPSEEAKEEEEEAPARAPVERPTSFFELKEAEAARGGPPRPHREQTQ